MAAGEKETEQEKGTQAAWLPGERETEQEKGTQAACRIDMRNMSDKRLIITVSPVRTQTVVF